NQRAGGDRSARPVPVAVGVYVRVDRVDRGGGGVGDLVAVLVHALAPLRSAGEHGVLVIVAVGIGGDVPIRQITGEDRCGWIAVPIGIGVGEVRARIGRVLLVDPSVAVVVDPVAALRRARRHRGVRIVAIAGLRCRR